MDAYDRSLLDDLDTLVEKLEKQAHPNKTGVALQGWWAYRRKPEEGSF